jgi:hypothetical protein
MSNDSCKWADANRQGSNTPPTGTGDSQEDTQTAIDRANRASDLHQRANELADHSRRSGKK